MTRFTFVYLIAFSFFGIGLLCIFGKDFIWEIDLRIRKAAKWPEDKLIRDAAFDRTFNFVGIYAIALGILFLMNTLR
jgi:hypothetical protein